MKFHNNDLIFCLYKSFDRVEVGGVISVIILACGRWCRKRWG